MIMCHSFLYIAEHSIHPFYKHTKCQGQPTWMTQHCDQCITPSMVLRYCWVNACNLAGRRNFCRNTWHPAHHLSIRLVTLAAKGYVHTYDICSCLLMLRTINLSHLPGSGWSYSGYYFRCQNSPMDTAILGGLRKGSHRTTVLFVLCTHQVLAQLALSADTAICTFILQILRP